jgi:hypothetical protein
MRKLRIRCSGAGEVIHDSVMNDLGAGGGSGERSGCVGDPDSLRGLGLRLQLSAAITAIPVIVARFMRDVSPQPLDPRLGTRLARTGGMSSFAVGAELFDEEDSTLGFI